MQGTNKVKQKFYNFSLKFNQYFNENIYQTISL